MNIQQRIDDHINKIFNFKKVGEWYRSGKCPQCSKKSCYTNAVTPRVIKCDHINKCGYEEHVKDICQDLFKDWSQDFPKTKESPTASADAYLTHARGLDHTRLRGLYTQELFRNEYKFGNEVSATIRFKIADGIYWERLIDRPERFGKQKANIIGKVTGLHWTNHDIETLAKADEIYLTEGIFNSIALSFSKLVSVATISSNNYPTQLLEQIKKYCTEELKVTTLPKLIWAFDNDKAGKIAVQKFHDKAQAEGWNSSAALPVSKDDKDLDWNDLHEREQLTAEHFKNYIHHGKLLIAENSWQAALLIYTFYNDHLNNFHFVHKLKTYWFSIDREKFDKEFHEMMANGEREEEAKEEAIKRTAKVKEICNAQIKALYFQRNEVLDQSFYYFLINGEYSSINATFTPEQITSKAAFTNRLLSISKGIWWKGTDQQLFELAQHETNPKYLKEVETIDYIGYSKQHQSYVFTKHAVHNGKLIHINQHDYYQVGKSDLKTLASQPEVILSESKFNPIWWRNNYTINGAKGLILMAWWVGSYFAEQIRAEHSSYPFVEYVGQAGSGKSSYLEFLWKLSGSINPKEGINPNSSTTAAIHRSMAQVSNLPVVLIEGDATTDQSKNIKQKFDWDELKDAFNGRNIRSRGLKTSGNETYEPPFKGSIMISQNDPIKATEAILSRTLHIYVDTKGHTYEKKRIADQLYKITTDEAATFITHCLKNEAKILETFFEMYPKIESEYHADDISHIRITKCHAQIAAMTEAIAKHVLNDYIDLEELCDAQAELKVMARKRIEDLQADHMLVNQFWDVYEYINSMQNSNFKLNHYQSNHAQIAININEVYKLAARHFQALPDVNTMRDLLKTSRRYKFIEMNKQVASTNAPVNESDQIKISTKLKRNVKCWIFDNPYFKQGSN